MAITSPIFVAALLLGSTIQLLVAASPTYTQCQSNSECAADHCCAISPIRYSVPLCRPLQAEGEPCRPVADTTFNLTVTYPNGDQADLTKIHYVICPCASGLICDKKTGICKNDGQSDYNYVLTENERD